MGEFTVVIPVKDDMRVGRCLASFDEARAHPLVVMNDPTQEVRELVERAGCDSLTLPTAGGPAACEAGMQGAGTASVLFMDSDCVFHPGALTAFAEAVGTADFVRGVTIFRHHTRLQRVVARSRVRHTNMPQMLFKVPLLVDRRVLPKIGGYLFDSRLAWTEDFDLTMRVRSSGATTRVLREGVVIHDALTPLRDLTSAYRYGQGHRGGVRLGLDGYKTVSWKSALSLPWGAIRRDDPTLAFYDHLFNLSFTAGYKFASASEGRRLDDLS
ncbi:glycosyltransferase family A protein [Micrococcus sp.]|uniref:glycosyltransferase family 2 protein n=1 Tax=Micrococcus sp. TaxID=1271 RepID=UPI002A9165F4|nr:glycosyltransferase family A protein [Micrococcus sp.]MDY6055162.1 glycosyltransferase family A protein [Micrococcus sp.]